MRVASKMTGQWCRVLAWVSLGAALGLAVPAGKAQAAPPLQAEMARIAAATRGPVGAAVQIVEGGRVVALHGERRFPMQSVYKLPIAMAVLHQADLGRLSLTERIRVTRADLPTPPHYSPLRDQYPNGAELTIAELLDAMMRVSDNTACDLLLARVGGPAQVTAYLRGLGFRDIVVATSEKAMAQSEQIQYRNWATPKAMVALLRTLQQGGGVSPSSRSLLLGLMRRCETGPHQIKALLPAGTIVAHKTGSSGIVNGLTRALNDVGLVTLPDGRHLAVVVFVSDTRAGAATQEPVIARIARAAWDRRAELGRR